MAGSGASDRVFALGDAARLADVAEAVVRAAHGFRVLQEPATGLVMMQAVDPAAGGSFNVGEVLVTSCLVEINGHSGCAVVLGDDPSRARAAAVLDGALAAAASLPPAVRDRMLAALADEERRIADAHRAEWALAERTRVEFETMEDRDAGARSRL